MECVLNYTDLHAHFATIYCDVHWALWLLPALVVI